MASAIWSKGDIDILKKNYLVKTGNDLQEMLPKFTIRQIRYKANELGLKKEGVSWSKSDIEILKDNYPTTTQNEILKLLPQYTIRQIRDKAKKMGLKKVVLWSEEDVELLKQVYRLKTASEIKELFPQFTSEQIYRKTKQLKLKKDELVVKKSRVENSIIQRQDLWEDEEIKILYEIYPEYGVEGVQEEIKEKLNKKRTKKSILHQANKRNIVRNQKNEIKWIVENVEFNTDDYFSVKFIFKGW